jgi:hypothetical protein
LLGTAIRESVKKLFWYLPKGGYHILVSEIDHDMPNVLTRTILFLSSYSPLFLIFSFHLWHLHKWTSGALTLVAVGSVVALTTFISYAQQLQPATITVESVKSRDGDVMSYIVTYLLPFLAVKLDDYMDALSFSLLLLVVAVLYINSNLIYVNPILNLMGYHIFEVDHAANKTSVVICKRHYLKASQRITAVSLGDYLLLEKY